MSQALTPTSEKQIRDYLKGRINFDYPNLPVMITPFYFSGREDAIGQLFTALTDQTTTLEEYKQKEIDFVMINFLRFQDSITEDSEACEGNPAVSVFYRIHIFKEFKDVRSNGTNSHDELVAMILTMRNRFLNNMDVSPRVTQFPLSCLDNLVRNSISEYLPGVKGDYINLQVRVESR